MKSHDKQQYLEGLIVIPAPITCLKGQEDIRSSLRCQKEHRVRRSEHHPTVNQENTLGLHTILVSGVLYGIRSCGNEAKRSSSTQSLEKSQSFFVSRNVEAAWLALGFLITQGLSVMD